MRPPVAWMAILVSLAVLETAPAIGKDQSSTLVDDPKALVDQAWQIVHRKYADHTFNSVDWQAVRQDYLGRSYSSNQEAYAAVQEMLKPLDDPYTRFLSPQNIKELVDKVSGEFIGVGLTVGVTPNGEWIVVSPLPGSPAAVQGVKRGDVVTRINGTQTASINPQQATPYIVGPVGSKVKLSIRRGETTRDLQLVREQIDLNPLTFKVQETAAGKVGYIQMPVFTTKSPKAMRNAIQALEAQQVKGYILDLRGNAGGVFEAGIEMARMWLGPKQLISLVDQRGEQERYETTQQGLTQKPLQVLIDKKSASASEVLAAALRDNRRATLVGTQTFGKGVIQSLEPLKDGSGIVLTVAKYVTPKGKDIHQQGITPDVEVPSDPTQETPVKPDTLPRDRQYQKALSNLLAGIQAQRSSLKSARSLVDHVGQ